MTNFGSHLFVVLVTIAFASSSSLADDSTVLEANTPTYKAGDAPAKTIKRTKPFKTKGKKKTKKNQMGKAVKGAKKKGKKTVRVLKPKYKTTKAKATKTKKNNEELPAPMPKDSQ